MSNVHYYSPNYQMKILQVRFVILVLYFAYLCFKNIFENFVNKFVWICKLFAIFSLTLRQIYEVYFVQTL